MNLKKLFASTLTVLMVATMFPVNLMANASYSDELQGAYDYAYDNGITTMDSIENANMYGTLTRIALAKMISNYAMDVLGLTPDTDKDCEFSDVSEALDAQYDNGVTNACQLGLMGVGIEKFNPNGIVTRAEFGTVLSRALRGDKYNGATPYYADHLSALEDAGVMNNISNPSAVEVRGYVMLMMQRADEDGIATPEVCKDPMVAIACALNPEDDACPAECRDVEEEEEEVLAGTVSVALGSDNLADGSEIPKAGIVRFATLKFSAASDSDVSLKTLEVEKLGLATLASSTRLWLEKDGVRVTGKAALNSDNMAVISFAPAYEIKAGKNQTFDLYVELNQLANENIQFGYSDLTSTAEDVNGGFTTPTLRTANYTVSTVTIANVAGGGTTSVVSNGMEIGAFSLALTNPGSQTRDGIFKSITLRQEDNASLSNLGNIVLERNGEVVSEDPIINGREITFSLSDEILDNTTATYYIKAVVNNVELSTDSYQFALRNTSDLNVVEKSTSFRTTISGTPTLSQYDITGGDLVFARDTNLELAGSYAPGTQEVVLMKGTLTSKSAITIEDPKLNYVGMDDDDMYDNFATIYLSIGASTFSYSPENGSATTFAQFLGSATVDGKVNVKVRGTLKQTAPAGVIKLAAMTLSSLNTAPSIVEYVSNGNAVTTAVGSIEGRTIDVEATALNVIRTDTVGDSAIAAGSTNVSVVKFNLTSTQGNGVRISRAKFDVTATNNYANNVTLTLYVNGVAKSTKTVSAATVTFDNFTETVKSNNPVTLEVKADFNEAITAGTTFKLGLDGTSASLNAVDALTSSAVTYSAVASATYTIGTANAQFSASNEVAHAQALLSPSTAQRVMTFRVKALNDSVKLRDLTFAGTNLNNLSNLRVTDSTGTVIATATSVTNIAITFENIASSAAPSIAKDQTDTYYLVADVKSDTNGVTTNATLNAVAVRASNGSTVNATGTPVVSATHRIIENRALVAKLANPSKAIATSALRFSVAAEGKEKVTITSLPLTLTTAGYTMGTQTIYRGNVSAGNEVLFNVAQVSTVTPGGTIEVGDVFTATINGLAISFTATATTVANVTAGLTAAINASAQAANVTAVDSTTHVTITSDAAGTSFTIAASLTDNGALTATNASATTTANVTAQNNVVDAGQTVTFIVAYPGTVITAGANQSDWSVSLTDVVYNSIAYSVGAKNFAINNVLQDFPMTETK